MLAGVPMIVSNIEPLLEVTADGEYAEVFPVGDETTLSEMLEGLLGDPTRRTKLAERAKAFALDNFSIDAHLRELTNLYRSLE
jgi:glycosyltransferase involved in cell wall biosynthesis